MDNPTTISYLSRVRAIMGVRGRAHHRSESALLLGHRALDRISRLSSLHEIQVSAVASHPVLCPIARKRSWSDRTRG